MFAGRSEGPPDTEKASPVAAEAGSYRIRRKTPLTEPLVGELAGLVNAGGGSVPSPDLRCLGCERGDDDLDPLVEAWVNRDAFWMCRSCIKDWLSVVWPEFHRRRAAC